MGKGKIFPIKLHLVPGSFFGDAKFFLFGAFPEFHFRDKRHLDSHGVQYLENGFETRMGFFVQSLVKTFTAESGLYGNLRHSLASGDVSDSAEK